MTTVDLFAEHQLFDEMMSEKVFNLHLNVAKGNMYDFVTHTWNIPLRGYALTSASIVICETC